MTAVAPASSRTVPVVAAAGGMSVTASRCTAAVTVAAGPAGITMTTWTSASHGAATRLTVADATQLIRRAVLVTTRITTRTTWASITTGAGGLVVDASDVEVKVDGGEVTLSGTVASRRMKRRAEDIADGIRGVHDVHNQLRVSRDSLSGDQGSHQGRGPRQDMRHQGSGSSAGQERSGKEQGLGSGRTEGAEPGQQQRKFGS